VKNVKDIVITEIDYGCFPDLSKKLSESVKKAYYHSPIDDEYRNVKDCIIGDGIDGVERIDEFMTPEIIKETDLFIFPDIGWGETQKYLKSIGKAVWGSMGADELELYRTRFLTLLKKLGLPVVPYKVITGLTNLSDHLKTVKNKWIKINRFRENMETWHHLDYEHSQRMLEYLNVEFGGVKELVVFIVQDDIPDSLELGFDGWSVDGQFPEETMQGYEKKNELYLGSKLANKDLPEEVRYVNEKMSPSLKDYGYRNFWATEIRVKDKTPYFIDPTPRMPGQTGEQLLETCSNLAEVIWAGANGELIKPEFKYDFAVEATLHYTENADIWKTIQVPSSIEQWVKLYHYCIVDGTYQFPPSKNDELGVVLGVGETIEKALDHLKKNMESLKDEPVCAHLDGFADLLEDAKKAQKQGIKFTDKEIPKPEVILK
jgi:hypothetical protein